MATRRRLPPMLTKLLLLVLVVEVVLPLVLVLGRNRVLFVPYRSRPEDALQTLRGLTDRVAKVRRPDGRLLSAFDLVPAGLAADAPVVLYLHGNAGNIATRAALAARFARTANVRVFIPDWSGFGDNDGSPSEDEINIDALAAYDHLVADGVDPARIVLFGESIGGAPAIWLATQRPVAGVAVESTISSLSSMSWRVFPWLPLAAVFVSGAFPNADRIATLTMPVLIVHGRNDRTVPFAEGERLAAALPSAEFLPVDGADHNDLFDIAGDDFLRGLGERFRRWTAH